MLTFSHPNPRNLTSLLLTFVMAGCTSGEILPNAPIDTTDSSTFSTDDASVQTDGSIQSAPTLDAGEQDASASEDGSQGATVHTDASSQADASTTSDASPEPDASTGGGAVPGVSSPSYGPNGTHWPSNTPAPDATFDYDVEVAPTWSAIQSAIDNAPASGNARVRVQPGTLPSGFGAGSTANSVLTGGSASRASKVLVVPRDGFGTVGASLTDISGYSFAIDGVAFMGFDFVNQAVVIRSAQNFAIGWGRFRVLNITANAGDSIGNELVECVLPNQENTDSDRSAFRCANNSNIIGAKVLGGYFAPAYKAKGSSSHCDTLQFSSTGGGLDDILIQDSIFFQSSSQTLMLANLDTVMFEHTAVIGGLRGAGRFPVAGDRHVQVAENALWGGAQDAHANGLVVMGSVSSSYSWTSVVDSVLSKSTGSSPGSFTIDSQFDGQSKLQTAWLDANSPEPTLSYLQTIWSAL